MDITSELTIVIPVRMDSKEREENLRAILPYLISYTYATILVMEVDEEQKFFLKNTDKRIKYYFQKDTDVIFHYTRYRNELLIRSETNIVAIWDADVFLTVSQLKAGIEWVKKGVTMCIPYDGRAFYLSRPRFQSACCACRLRIVYTLPIGKIRLAGVYGREILRGGAGRADNGLRRRFNADCGERFNLPVFLRG